MKCQVHRETIVDLARRVGVPGPVADAAQAHISECAQCRALLARERELSAGLDAVNASMENVAPPAALDARVMAAFDALTDARSGLVGADAGGLREGAFRTNEASLAAARHGSARAKAGRALAVAASIVLVTGVAISRLDVTFEHPVPPPAPVAVLPEGPVTPSLTSIAIEFLSNDLSRSAAPPTTANAERVIVFQPVPGASTLPAFESARILRTEMPVEALPAYGVEIVPDAARRRIVLDLLVGQDGFARGVRVVTGAH
jgi:hypothetical protein